jgi:hypothetical protein
MNHQFEIVADRELILISNGMETPIKISIGRPYRESDGAYFCPYTIIGFGTELSRKAGGVDGIHALQLALVMIGAELSVYSDSLRWGSSASTGFPKSIHDPVIGDAEE